MVAIAVALLLAYQARRGRLVEPWWWFAPPAIALVPILGLAGFEAVVDDAQRAKTLARFALWGTGFVATICALFVTYGRAGDGRAVRWVAALIALLGIIAVAALDPRMGALIAPLTVFAVVARALPSARSVVARRRTVAALGVAASASVAAAHTMTTATPVFGVAVVVMSVVIAVSLVLDVD